LKIISLKDNSIIFKAKVNGLEDIKRWVMGYGRLAKVIKPKELRDQIVEEVYMVSQIYHATIDKSKIGV
jgi:predicted DNA-binding transcriptional regulator YafY